jgi:hypothetical protein
MSASSFAEATPQSKPFSLLHKNYVQMHEPQLIEPMQLILMPFSFLLSGVTNAHLPGSKSFPLICWMEVCDTPVDFAFLSFRDWVYWRKTSGFLNFSTLKTTFIFCECSIFPWDFDNGGILFSDWRNHNITQHCFMEY